MKKEIVEHRLRIWQSLLDASIYFALAEIRHKGYSEKESWDRLRRQWAKTSLEHHRANLEIIKKLHAAEIKTKRRVDA